MGSLFRRRPTPPETPFTREYPPGARAPVSGRYGLWRDGEPVELRHVTRGLYYPAYVMDEGQPLPPAPVRGCVYRRLPG